MAERNDVNRPAREPGEEQDRADQRGGHRIPGRNFAGTSYASTEREQTADHLGESQKFRMDDAVEADTEQRDVPRDES
jgi:hypothetical protein